MSLRKGIGFCQQSEPRFLNAVFIVFITDPISGGPVSQYPIEIWLSKKLCSLFACTDDNVKIKFTKMDRLIFTNLDRII